MFARAAGVDLGSQLEQTSFNIGGSGNQANSTQQLAGGGATGHVEVFSPSVGTTTIDITQGMPALVPQQSPLSIPAAQVEGGHRLTPFHAFEGFNSMVEGAYAIHLSVRYFGPGAVEVNRLLAAESIVATRLGLGYALGSTVAGGMFLAGSGGYMFGQGINTLVPYIGEGRLGGDIYNFQSYISERFVR